MADGLNTPPATGNARLDQFLRGVHGILTNRLVRPGPDRAPTQAELETGVIIVPSNDSNLTTPPTPTNVAADGGLGLVFLSWDTPTYRGHSYAEVFRNNSDTIGSAQKIGTSASSMYVDNVTDTVTRYYWVRFVNSSGVTGPFHAVNGVSGAGATDPGYMLSLLTGKITESQLYTSLGSRINMIDAPATTIGSVAHRIAIESKARSDDDAAINTRIDALVAMAGGDTDEILAAIQSEQTARIDGDTALASRVDTVVATATNDRNNFTGGLQTEQTARVNADSALSTRIDTVVATANADRGTFSANLQTEQSARVSADSALSSRVDTVVATANTDRANTAAAIQTEQTARADADGALSTRVDTVQTTVDGHTTSIRQQVSSINGLSAQYTVKIDSNGYVSGFGLASDSSGTPSSSFIVRSDNFAIGSPSGPGVTPIVPFTVQTTPTTINGEYVPVGVYMDGAYMKNGTITNAKLGNAVITTAKIADLAVNNAKIANLAVNNAKIADLAVSNSKIADLAVDTAKIADLAVTNAKIANLSVDKLLAGTMAVGQYMQSQSYSAGVSGWRLNSDGSAEFGNIKARGDVEATSLTTPNATIDASGHAVFNSIEINRPTIEATGYAYATPRYKNLYTNTSGTTVVNAINFTPGEPSVIYDGVIPLNIYSGISWNQSEILAIRSARASVRFTSDIYGREAVWENATYSAANVYPNQAKRRCVLWAVVKVVVPVEHIAPNATVGPTIPDVTQGELALHVTVYGQCSGTTAEWIPAAYLPRLRIDWALEKLT